MRCRALQLPLVVATLVPALVGLAGCPDAAGSAGNGDAEPDAADVAELDAAGDGDDAEVDAPFDVESDAAIAVSDLTVTQNPANVLSVYVGWRTAEPAPTHLAVSCDDGYDQRFSGTAPSTRHEVFVMALTTGSQCTAAAGDATADFEVDALPDWLPDLTVATADAERIQPGFTLFNLHNGPSGLPPSVVMVDAQSRYRWYYRAATTETGLDNDVRTVDEGVLMQVPPRIVDWEGKTVWDRPLPMHHDVRPAGEPGHLYYLTRGPCPGDQPESDVVVEYDREADEVVWEWSLCEHYTPMEIVPDWAHLNTIEPFPDENALLLSSRHQNALFKVDLDTEEVVWRLGQDGDFLMFDSDAFFHQHAPEIEPSGSILLFDNGTETRRYSRALELEYRDTGDDWAADVIWEYTPDPPIYCFSWGDADRLPNGNTLVTFGVEFPEDGPSHLIEVTADQPAEEVWDVVFPTGWAMYRAERVVSPPMGFVSANP